MPALKEVIFGHVLCNEGLKADPGKSSAVISLESLTDKAQLCVILVMFSYLAKLCLSLLTK